MRKIVLAIVLCSSPAFAQSASEQALAQKLMVEIGAGVQCSARGIETQQQLFAAQARVKALEDKYEPKITSPPGPPGLPESR